MTPDRSEPAPAAPGRWLTEAEALAMMIERAVDWSAIWADRAFVAIGDDISRSVKDPTARERAIEVAAQQCLVLIADTENLASYLDLNREQRRQFIADRAGVFTARLERLISMTIA